MILVANFLMAVAKITHLILILYVWILIIRAVLSWVQVPSLSPIYAILYSLTEPVLRPVRRLVPPYKMGGLDISPIIVILLILFVDSFLVHSMTLYAQQLLRESSRTF